MTPKELKRSFCHFLQDRSTYRHLIRHYAEETGRHIPRVLYRETIGRHLQQHFDSYVDSKLSHYYPSLIEWSDWIDGVSDVIERQRAKRGQ